MLLLTRDTVDDSATVRVVTLVTLIYLPASFVSVRISGLRLNQLDVRANGIAVAPGNELVRISKFRRDWVPNFQTILDLHCINSPFDNTDGWIMVLYCAYTTSEQGCTGANGTATAAWIRSIIQTRAIGYLKLTLLEKQSSLQVRFDGQQNNETPHSHKSLKDYSRYQTDIPN